MENININIFTFFFIYGKAHNTPYELAEQYYSDGLPQDVMCLLWCSEKVAYKNLRQSRSEIIGVMHVQTIVVEGPLKLCLKTPVLLCLLWAL